MEFLVIIAALIILDIAALLWGIDSREGFTGDQVTTRPAWYPI